jgi:arginyl-tRNA--protein-N-Asp/Glu arginylyltransferase
MTGTPGTDLILINEEFFAASIEPDVLDTLLAEGWRHFGTHFFRYSLNLYNDEIRRVMPLRIRIADFRASASQRRALRKNADLRVENRAIEITDEADELFHRHKQRFDHGVPASVYEFLSTEPDSVPCEGRELAVYDGERLVAVSYLDIGARSLSGIYAMFDPDEAHRGLGIFTMLKEIEYALDTRREFYYQGYAYEGNSFYDYKKRFAATEEFDWRGHWQALGG